MSQIAPKTLRDAPRRSLRARLLLLVVLVVVLAVAPIAILAAWHDSTRAATLQNERLKASAQVLASMAADATAKNDREAAFRIISAIRKIEGANYARIDDIHARILVEAGAGARLSTDLQMNSGHRPFDAGTLFSQSTELAIPITLSRRRVGTLTILGQTNDVLGIFVASLLESAGIALLVILGGVALAWRLQAAIMEPLAALYRRMEHVRKSHVYGEPLNIQSSDEVGSLVMGFNEMMAEIRVRDLRLAAHMNDLERQVQDRTVDLERAKDLAEEANRAKSDFLAAMSHEIRTPMNGIMVMAEMLADSSLPPRQQRFADVIANAGSSLLSIINDILDFSKTDAGKLQIESIPTDIGAIVDDVLSLFWERAQTKGLGLGAFVSPAMPLHVSGDPTRLRQILSNLVNNALKFTDHGSVTIEALANGDRLWLRVIDTGIGIPADKIDGLFEAFTQVDQSTTRKYGGTGLGLAICKKLVDLMDGRVIVESVVGRGTTFLVDLPMIVLEPPSYWPRTELKSKSASIHLDEHAQSVLSRYLENSDISMVNADADIVFGDPAFFERSAHVAGVKVCIADFSQVQAQNLLAQSAVDVMLYRPIRQSDIRELLGSISSGKAFGGARQPLKTARDSDHPSFSGMSVLVADDSPVNLEVAREALTKLGATIHCVSDGMAAVAAAGDPKRNFDLVLMDGSMPLMDGFEATLAIRETESSCGLPRLPIVALTAHVVGAAAEAWKKADMDGVLHKPFTLKSLSAVLAKYYSGTLDVELNNPVPIDVTHDDILNIETLEGLLAMSGGDLTFIANLFRLYRESGSASIDRLSEAVAAGDHNDVTAAAHALKSMSFNIGAATIARLAGDIEAQGREGNLCTEGELQQLRLLFEQTLGSLLAFQATPPESKRVA